MDRSLASTAKRWVSRSNKVARAADTRRRLRRVRLLVSCRESDSYRLEDEGHGLVFEGSSLFGFYLQVEIDCTASTANGFRTYARRRVKPRFTRRTAKTFEEVLVCRNHRLKILFSKIGPLIVVNGLIYRPLFYI